VSKKTDVRIEEKKREIEAKQTFILCKMMIHTTGGW
jgi:hypothetical protein